MRSIIVFIWIYLCTIHGIALGAQKEKVAFLFNTERQLYASGEKVRFAVIFKGDISRLSPVLTLDLLTPDGNFINGQKYNLCFPVVCNEFAVPAHVNAGNYVLRAYTGDSNKGVNQAMQIISIVNNGHLVPPRAYNIQNVTESNDLIINLKRNTAGAGTPSKIKFELFNKGNDIKGSLSLTKASVSSRVSYSKLVESESEIFSSNGDRKGVRISGEVINERTGKPEAYKRVDFSSAADPQIFKCCSTDEAGVFDMYFPFAIASEHVIISVCTTDSILIKLNSQYRNTGTAFNSLINKLEHPDTMSGRFEKAALEIYRVAQLKKYFASDSIQKMKAEASYWFYGKPDYSIITEKFIPLPTMEDYILELIPGTYSRILGGEKKIMIVEKNNNFTGYEPLLLIDGIPVYDLKEFLNIDVKQIFKIELVRSVYRHGDYVFGGIINVISKANNLAGIALKGNHRIFDVDFLSNEPPVTSTELVESANVLANYSYWNPDLTLGKGELEEIEVTTPAIAGEYVLSFKGLDAEGWVKTADYFFRVNY